MIALIAGVVLGIVLDRCVPILLSKLVEQTKKV